jgi:hypothetical protein
MTIDELDGKWITWGDKDYIVKINKVKKNGTFYAGVTRFNSIEELHETGAKWNDKPSFNNLKSLEVDA